MEAKLERALKEIGQLKIDREVAIEKREKQVCISAVSLWLASSPGLGMRLSLWYTKLVAYGLNMPLFRFCN